MENFAMAGIGCHLERMGPEVMVSATSEGGSAKHGGLQIGSIIVAVDGVAVQGRELQEVREMIMGPAGTVVTLTILEPFLNLRHSATQPMVNLNLVRTPKRAPALAMMNSNVERSQIVGMNKEFSTEPTFLPVQDMRFGQQLEAQQKSNFTISGLNETEAIATFTENKAWEHPEASWTPHSPSIAERHHQTDELWNSPPYPRRFNEYNNASLDNLKDIPSIVESTNEDSLQEQINLLILEKKSGDLERERLNLKVNELYDVVQELLLKSQPKQSKLDCESVDTALKNINSLSVEPASQRDDAPFVSQLEHEQAAIDTAGTTVSGVEHGTAKHETDESSGTAMTGDDVEKLQKAVDLLQHRVQEGRDIQRQLLSTIEQLTSDKCSAIAEKSMLAQEVARLKCSLQSQNPEGDLDCAGQAAGEDFDGLSAVDINAEIVSEEQAKTYTGLKEANAKLSAAASALNSSTMRISENVILKKRFMKVAKRAEAAESKIKVLEGQLQLHLVQAAQMELKTAELNRELDAASERTKSCERLLAESRQAVGMRDNKIAELESILRRHMYGDQMLASPRFDRAKIH